MLNLLKIYQLSRLFIQEIIALVVAQTKRITRQVLTAALDQELLLIKTLMGFCNSNSKARGQSVPLLSYTSLRRKHRIKIEVNLFLKLNSLSYAEKIIRCTTILIKIK